MARAQRLTRRADLQRLQREGKAFRTRYFTIRTLASPHPFARVGLVVPLHRHTAVDRNRLKRRLREVVRQELLPRLGPLDVVFRTTEAAYRLPFDGLRAAVGEAGRRLWAKEGNE